MVIGAPRSGTAWAANWLSGLRLCLHDPLWDYHYTELDHLPAVMAIACTGIAYFHGWVNDHPCPKVILHRPKAEIDVTLRRIGLPPVEQRLLDCLWKVKGYHVPWTDLFDGKGAVKIHEALRLGAFNCERHQMLRNFHVTENWRQRRQNPAVWNRLKAEIEATSSETLA